MSESNINRDEAYYLAQYAIEYAEKKGVREAEVFFSDNKKLEVTCSGKEIANEKEVQELGFGIRVLQDSVEGFSYTNKADKKAIEQTVEQAIVMLKVKPKKEGIALAPPSSYSTIEGLFSKQLSTFTVEELIDSAKQILLPFEEAPISVKTDLSRIILSEEYVGIANSLGVEGNYIRNSLDGSFLAIAREGEKVGSFVSDSFSVKDPKEVDFYKFGKELVERAIRNVNVEKLKGIDSDIVVFKPDAVLSPIFIVIAMAISAERTQHNQSLWKDSIGEKVAIDDFSFIDNSLDGKSSTARPFDDEGTPVKELEIIKDGVLMTHLFDIKTANKANTQSTGNSYRGFINSSFMNPPNNIFPNVPVIKPGDTKYDEMIEDIKEGIVFEYFAGSQRSENGIFSGVAKGAQLIKNGEITTPLTNVTIAGNVFDVLKNIVSLSKTTKKVNGYLETPYIKTKGINISSQN
ncbi:MAG: TldD/PmbA family protein [Candidatus Heimdallarchaeaceae archaeon]